MSPLLLCDVIAIVCDVIPCRVDGLPCHYFLSIAIRGEYTHFEDVIKHCVVGTLPQERPAAVTGEAELGLCRTTVDEAVWAARDRVQTAGIVPT